MPRQRKPQSGVARAAGRVANTTTSLGGKDIANTNPKVYRIPTGGMRTECPAPLSEVGGVYPISVRREGNIFYVSLPEENLKSVIEGMETLDLSNVTVTLNTVEGPITVTGNITTDGTLIGNEVQANTVTATDGNITNVTATDVTSTSVDTNSLTSETSSLGAATATSIDTQTLAVSGTSQFTGNITAEGDATINGNLTATSGDITSLSSESATIGTLSVTNGASVVNGLTADATTTTTLDVSGASSFTGDITAGNITSTGTSSLDTLIVSGNTTLNTLTANGASTLNGNASIAGNLSVTGNETITGNVTVTGDGVFSNDVSVSRNLNVSGDTTLTDDLTVNGTTHLKGLETDGSVDIDGTLRVSGAINGLNGLNVTGQVESETVRTNEVIANEVRVTDGLYLSQGAEAPDFVLQSEKGEPNGVAPLNANGIVPEEHLPPIYTSAIVKVGVGSFSNSNTSTVVDSDITADSYVHISNYQDIVGDLDENIIPGSGSTPGQITVVSNQVENGSYKYIVVNPLTNCNS